MEHLTEETLPKAPLSRLALRGATPDSASVSRPIAEGAAWTVEGTCDFWLHCDSGTLWLTNPEAYPGDIVLVAGERVRVSPRGKTVIVAMSRSTLRVPEELVLDDPDRYGTRRLRVRSWLRTILSTQLATT